ncbi:hypothetical protein ACG7TL_008223 [Trametes sanguinea]
MHRQEQKPPKPQAGILSRWWSTLRPRSAPPDVRSAGIHTPLQETERQYSPTPRPAHDAPQETVQQKETSPAPTSQVQDFPLPASTDGTIGVVDDSFSAATPLDQQRLSVVGSERGRSPGTHKCPPELASEKKSPLHMGTLGPDVEEVPRQPVVPERHLGRTLMNGLKITLNVMKEASAAFPPLQSVAGGLLAIVDVVEQVSTNKADIRTVEAYVVQLNNMVSPTSLPPMAQWPSEFKKRLDDFVNLRQYPAPADGMYRELKKIEQDMQCLASETRAGRVVNARERAGKVSEHVQSLGRVVQTFTRVEGKIDGGVQHLDEQFLGVHTHIDEALERHRNQSLLTIYLIQLQGPGGAIPGLHPTFSAMYNDSEGGRSECEPETRREALATIFAWILGPGHPDLSAFPPPVLDVDHHRPIMWLYALAGAGKSTLAQTTAQWCDSRRILAASFFCARDGDRSNVLAIMPTIAQQLARLCVVFREALREAVANNPNVHQMSVASQLQTLIVRPLRTALDGGSQAFDDLVVIIDAVDECMDDEAVSVVVKSLSLHHERVAPLKFLVTSRPEPNIKAGFLLPALAANTQEFPLSKIPDEHTARDIKHFLGTRLQEVRRRYDLEAEWPSEDQLSRLVALTELLFIFAATAVLYVGDKRARNPKAQLDRLLEAGRAASALRSSKTSPFKVLDAIYIQALMLGLNDLEEEAGSQLQLMLATVTLAQERLLPATLEALLDLPAGTAMRLLPSLHAILALPSSGDRLSPLRLIHLSFADFIVDPSRCTEPTFLIYPSHHHALLSKSCLRILLTLRHNICDVDRKHSHLLNSEIPDLQETVARHLTAERQYAVKYWAHHLRHAAVDEELLSALQAFCDSHLLDWLEALSLLGCVDVAVAALQSAQQTLKNSQPPLPPTDAPALLYDCERIVRAFYEGISASFFEVLRATATFAPLSSPLRQRHAAHLPGMVLLRRGRETAWSATLTSTASNRLVDCLDFSPDGNVIACGTQDGGIELRNVQTGAEAHVLAGESWIMSVCFAPDGKGILSGDAYGFVTLWDVATGACLGRWQRHSDWIRSVAWSSDGTLAASGSTNGKIVLWSVDPPEESSTLFGHQGRVNSVVFSCDGALISGSDDKTCKIWDTRTKSLLRTLEHDLPVCCVAVSPDSQIVACGQWYGEITLWSKADGAKLHLLPGSAHVISLAFRANGTLAAAYNDSSLILWDVRTKQAFTRSLTMFSTVHAVAFSPDGVHIGVSTGVAVHIIRWPTDGSGMFQPSGKTTELSELDSHAPPFTAAGSHNREDVLGLSISPDGCLVVAVLIKEVLLLEVSTGDVVHTLEYSGRVVISPIVWSSDARYVAWGAENDVWVWETKPGGRIRSLAGHSDWVRAVHFTRDEQHVLSASEDGTILRWNVYETHPSPAIPFQCDGRIRELAVSSDGKWMLSGSLDRTPPDTSSPDLIAKPSRKPFVNDGYYPTLRLHEASGRVLWIEHVTGWMTSLAFSDDCTRAVAGLKDGRILLYDLTQLLPHRTTSSNASTPLSHPALIVTEYEFSTGSRRMGAQISFSPDGRGLVSSESYTVVPAELRPLSTRYTDLSLPPAYFFKHGWLWSSDPDIGSQRLCWMPPAFRYIESYPERFWSVHGHIIVCGTRENGVAILDASHCQR